MKKTQEHLLQLMREILDVCTDQDIPFALHAESAWFVKYCGGQFGNTVSLLRIMMTGKDAETLASALTERSVQEKSPRAIESLHTNPFLRQNIIRYVDTSTTLIDRRWLGNVEQHGIAVEIIPLLNADASRPDQLFEGGLLYLNGGQECREVDYRGKLQMSIEATRHAISVMGRKRAADRVWSMTRGSQSGKTAKGKMLIRLDGGSLKKIDSSFLKNTELFPLEDLQLPVSAGWEKYGMALCGDKWQERFSEGVLELSRPDRITDADVPFSQTAASLREAGTDLAKMADERRAYVMDYVTKYLPAAKKVQDDFQSANRSVDRLDIYAAIRPQRAELRRAARKGDLKKMEEILKPYLEAVDRYLGKGMGFYLDREVYDYAARIWRKKGQKLKAAKVLILTPSAHRRDDLNRVVKEGLGISG